MLFKTINLRSDVRSLFLEHFDKYLKKEMDVYDVGCGSKPFSSALEGRVKNYIGVDVEDGFYDSSHIDLVGTAYNVPVGSDVADAVISSQVLEHLESPENAIKETSRILKKNGLFFLSFPFLYPLHAEPHDFSRITEFNIKRMLKAESFEILEFNRIGGFWYLSGLFLGIYLQPIDRGILKKMKISAALLWFIRWVFHLLHSLEEFALKMLGKNPENLRRKWTAGYVLVARKLEK